MSISIDELNPDDDDAARPRLGLLGAESGMQKLEDSLELVATQAT